MVNGLSHNGICGSCGTPVRSQTTVCPACKSQFKVRKDPVSYLIGVLWFIVIAVCSLILFNVLVEMFPVSLSQRSSLILLTIPSLVFIPLVMLKFSRCYGSWTPTKKLKKL